MEKAIACVPHLKQLTWELEQLIVERTELKNQLHAEKKPKPVLMIKAQSG